jgi:hypothetical protein
MITRHLWARNENSKKNIFIFVFLNIFCLLLRKSRWHRPVGKNLAKYYFMPSHSQATTEWTYISEACLNSSFRSSNAKGNLKSTLFATVFFLHSFSLTLRSTSSLFVNAIRVFKAKYRCRKCEGRVWDEVAEKSEDDEAISRRMRNNLIFKLYKLYLVTSNVNEWNSNAIIFKLFVSSTLFVE